MLQLYGGNGLEIAPGASLFAGEFVKRLYISRNFSPAWVRDGRVIPAVDTLIACLDSARAEGLLPDDYHSPVLDSILCLVRESVDAGERLAPSILADLELSLTDACAVFATHLAYGKVDPESLSPRRSPPGDDSILVRRLPDVLGTPTIGNVLRSLVPIHPAYLDLREALALLRARGMESRRTLFRESLLYASGKPLTPSILRDFQSRCGIDTSGLLDSLTQIALRISPEERQRQVLCNLDRWRQMPRELAPRRVVINIPDFRLTVLSGEHEELATKVVVGLPSWPTPTLTSAITTLVFNPHWLSPRRVFVKELMGYLRADSAYLTSNRMTLVQNRNGRLVQVDPVSVPWDACDPESLGLQLLQEPGPQNIVGRVKFLVPNKHHIFLHDTPYREDFPKRLRMASHGCIRIEAPFDLAVCCLRGMAGWTQARVDSVVAKGDERFVSLKDPLPVYVVYCTVWRDPAGKMQFRDDVYDLDRKMAKILAAPLRSPASGRPE